MMEDVGMISTTHAPRRKESLLAAHDLLRKLEANDSLTDDMKKILAEIDLKLSMNLSVESETIESAIILSKEGDLDDVKERFQSAKEKIMVWESNNSMINESGLEMVEEYVEAVQEVRSLVERLRSLCLEENEMVKELIVEAEEVVQAAMARLEEELLYILVQKRQSYEPGGVEGEVSEGDTGTVDKSGRICYDIIEPEAIPLLKSIKNSMFSANYDQEFCSAYTRTEKEVLEDCLIGLGMEKYSIDELLKMEWSILDSKIKTWVQVIKTAVRVYLAAEKRLCSQILGESGPDTLRCFVNTTKSAMSCLLIFGHAMSLGPHTPEKLFNLLDMYEALEDVHGEINTLFTEDDGSFVWAEFQEVKERLGESAKATLTGFGNVILSDPSNDPFPGGGVHPLTSYVMNYIIVYLPDYCDTLNTLLQEKGEDNNVTLNQVTAECSVLGSHLRSLAGNLKSNLEKKSHLYKDSALQHVFLMNNLHYLQNKVMGSELRGLFGDDWIRTQIVLYQQHATSYVRTTWSSVVAALRDDGIPSGSGSGVKAVLKEKIRLFSVAFEEVYRNQTGWIIRDEQLKEELRISISQKVILAYQSFIGRHSKYDIEKYVKYDSDDLEDLLRDFFEGSQKSLHYTRRR